ncbi:MAG TPA: mannonate dehydratase [Thermomicrobiales bacterium]|nr:mannonate dehydratase [Thermomicrobiales bacterium]
MKVLLRSRDLSDDYIRFAAQIGADGFDIHHGKDIPGVPEQGYADEQGVRKLLDKLHRWGLGLYRVAPPDPVNYLLGRPGGDAEVDNLCRTLEVLGKVGVPFMSTPVHLGINPGYQGMSPRVHRGGYRMAGFELEEMRRNLAAKPPEIVVDTEVHFERCVRLYERLVPIAEAYDIRLIMHPSDPPLPETEFSPRRWSRILDAVPSAHSGLLYCVGTRYESGVNIHDDIRAFGRRGKIFHIHLRNVRGQIPTTGGYEEILLHDGDMNMFRVLQSLKAIGFDGGLQIDHLPDFDGDNAYQGQATAYGVGYAKALLAALEA